jgi:hypothetical protein
MMVPLLYFALADTVIAEVPDDMVFIHEWGVVELDEGYLEAKGARCGYLDEGGYLVDYYPVEAEAPVVWFHGAECTGTFSVEVTGGDFTLLLPQPDSIAFHTIPGIEASETRVSVWEGLQIVGRDELVIETEEEIPWEEIYLEDFSWAMPFWREVPSNVLIYPHGDFKDTFLYYECSVNGYGMFSGECYGYEGPALLFYADSGELVCIRMNTSRDQADEPEVLQFLSEQEIQEEFCHWASNGLKSSEIAALWNTWEPVLRTRCQMFAQTVMVFPLSAEQIESISRIRFVPDGNYQVRYDRLFLGLGVL